MPQIKSDKHDFDPKKSLSTMGEGRQAVALSKKQAVFTQGDPADTVFYIQGGKVRLTVVSKTGKEATLGILSDVRLMHVGRQCAKSSL